MSHTSSLIYSDIECYEPALHKLQSSLIFVHFLPLMMMRECDRIYYDDIFNYFFTDMRENYARSVQGKGNYKINLKKFC